MVGSHKLGQPIPHTTDCEGCTSHKGDWLRQVGLASNQVYPGNQVSVGLLLQEGGTLLDFVCLERPSLSNPEPRIQESEGQSIEEH